MDQLIQEFRQLLQALTYLLEKFEAAINPPVDPPTDPVEPPIEPPVEPPVSGSFTEPEPGLLMAQAEKFDLWGSGFEVQSDVAGFSGSGYITYTGADSFQETGEHDYIQEVFTPTKSGTYQLQIHNRADDPNDPSQGNDTWVKIDGESFYADDNGTKVFAKGNPYGETNVTATNDSDDGFLKFYSNASGDWTMQTSAIDNRPRQIMVELEAGKQYTFEMAGRSNGHSIDAVFLRHVDLGPAVINKYLGVADPGPIDPPIEPHAEPNVTVEVISKGSLDAGDEGFFEAIVSGISTDQINQVEFYLDGDYVNTERVYEYESWPAIPTGDFMLKAVVKTKDGNEYEGFATFEGVSYPTDPVEPPTDPVEPPVTPPGTPVDVSGFDTIVSGYTGLYYSLNPDSESVGVKSDNQVAAMFGTGATHMGKPSDRARIVDLSQLGRKAFTFIMNGQSGGYSNRFASQKTNAGNSTYYEKAKAVASYSELFFDSSDFKMRTHFKASSFQPLEGTPTPGSNSTGPNPRSTQPGRAEAVRWEFYSKKSQSSPNNKGDMMKLYFGEHTYWSAEDYARMDGPDNFVMGPAFYTQHPNMPYKYQNMLYPCKPDANGNPTRERFLMPTDKLIRSWMVWESNTLNADGSGNYDGRFLWWLQIDGVNDGKPWLAGIVVNHLWVNGKPLIIAQAGVGAYFNNTDTPKETNQFYILRDDVYFLSI